MRSLLLCALLSSGTLMIDANLRFASQPNNNYAVRQRNNIQFISNTSVYMEPSDFGYQNLMLQRDNGGYDQFLRSSIDNEQDKRDFYVENGRDMLPFRSFESSTTTSSNDVKNKLPAGASGAITATPGIPYLIPLRWQQPHAAELEVNLWIQNMVVVVPIRRPTCSGEGYQDNVISFTIPNDFNTAVPLRVPNFRGCKFIGDCVLQVYAHSVEPRTYAIGVPIIITGDVGPTTTVPNIEAARLDPGLDLSNQPRELCLSSSSPDADIKSAVPRSARLISDVSNHAYQSSDSSPYSGQQPECISKNLQAAIILGMIPANRGELGRALTKKENPAAAAFVSMLSKKVKDLTLQYEGIVNQIIIRIGDTAMKNTATIGLDGVQKLAYSFRAAEVGSITTVRLRTTTYIPAFQLPPVQVAAARAIIPSLYSGLLSADGTIQLYRAVLNDFKAEFNKASSVFGINYMGPIMKSTLNTMIHETHHKKLNANGQQDDGVYAAQQFKTQQQSSTAHSFSDVLATPLTTIIAQQNVDFTTSAPTGYTILPTADLSGVMYDTACDTDTYTAANLVECDGTNIMFLPSISGSGNLVFQMNQYLPVTYSHTSISIPSSTASTTSVVFPPFITDSKPSSAIASIYFSLQTFHVIMFATFAHIFFV